LQCGLTTGAADAAWIDTALKLEINIESQANTER
jgi:hypothetical protein